MFFVNCDCPECSETNPLAFNLYRSHQLKCELASRPQMRMAIAPDNDTLLEQVVYTAQILSVSTCKSADQFPRVPGLAMSLSLVR